MGRKMKNIRAKDNAKPSSSSHSAELLESSVPSFNGFLLSPDPGSSLFTNGMTDVAIDANVKSELQIILRKMAKKDPITKAKGLQELCELLNAHDVETVITFAQIWTKFYNNLANDLNIHVRSNCQEVMSVVALKCKKAIAPQLKDLVPTWLVARFDSYAPASSIADESFKQTFANDPEKIRKAYLFCQREILEHIQHNIASAVAMNISGSSQSNANVTTNVAATTSNMSAEDENQLKYFLITYGNLRALSYFLGNISDCDDAKVQEVVKGIFAMSKFWNIAKFPKGSIKYAWFEMLYTILNTAYLANVCLDVKRQIVTSCFQSLDETDPLAGSFIWKCIILVQTGYDDWHEIVGFKKHITLKLCTFLRNGCNANALVCPHLVPFLTNVSKIQCNNNDMRVFYKRFFDDYKTFLVNCDVMSECQYSHMVETYFNCMQCILQHLKANVNVESTDDDDDDDDDDDNDDEWRRLAKSLIMDNVIDILKTCLLSAQPLMKVVYVHCSTLIVFLETTDASKCRFYKRLLNIYWTDMTIFITTTVKNANNTQFMDNVIELLTKLYNGKPQKKYQKVKFNIVTGTSSTHDITRIQNGIDDDDDNYDCMSMLRYNEYFKNAPNTTPYVYEHLKAIVIELVQYCLSEYYKDPSSLYIYHIRKLTRMYYDEHFYMSICNASTMLDVSLCLLKMLDVATNKTCNIAIDIIFDMMALLPKEERIICTKNHLLKCSQSSHIQRGLINRLLSPNPLHIETDVVDLLSTSEVSEIMMNIANDVYSKNSRMCFIILRKCFFQTDIGCVIQNETTIDIILQILCRPLIRPDTDGMSAYILPCCTFIIDVLPVLYGKINCLKSTHDIFVILFQFVIEQRSGNILSKEIMSKINTCWQDALINQNICADKNLIEKCAAIVERVVHATDGGGKRVSLDAIETIAHLIRQFIACATSRFSNDNELSSNIDFIIEQFFKRIINANTWTTLRSVEDKCLFMECLHDGITCDASIVLDRSGGVNAPNIEQLFSNYLLIITLIYKVICKPSSDDGTCNSKEEDESNENNNKTNEWSESCINVLLTNRSKAFYDKAAQCIKIAALGESYIKHNVEVDENLRQLVRKLVDIVKKLLRCGSHEFSTTLTERLLNYATAKEEISSCRTLRYLLYSNHYEQFEDNASMLLLEELSYSFLPRKCLKAYVNTIRYLLPFLSKEALTPRISMVNVCAVDAWIKIDLYRCIVQNNCNASVRTKILLYLTEVIDVLRHDSNIYLFNIEIHTQDLCRIVNAMEYVGFLGDVVKYLPYELSTKQWDGIIIALSSWILSVSKSIEEISHPHVLLFTAKVFRLFNELTLFCNSEKEKSSTEFLTNIVDEWAKVFAPDVNVVLLKIYYKLMKSKEGIDILSKYGNGFLEVITPSLELVEYEAFFNFCNHSKEITIDNLMDVLLRNLFTTNHCVRVYSAFVIKEMAKRYATLDVKIFEQKCETLNVNGEAADWHFLTKFEKYIETYETSIRKYLKDFSFKPADVPHLTPVDVDESMAYLLLCDCLLYACSHAPGVVHSIYSNWLHEKHYEENLLHFLFRVMPVDILKNYDSNIVTTSAFKGLTWNEIKDRKFCMEIYACHLYMELLGTLPAVVRKYWNTCNSKQKAFMDKLTANYVSPIIINKELKLINTKRDKERETMQLSVRYSTREIITMYYIGEAQMELAIHLSNNYPLGFVKVESLKQIGGRLSARNMDMHLTVFLMNQNGPILDGVLMWKKDLDKKYEGVEECFVCYTVIHQDTCELPKLTCKTCRKRFHGPCLYKWFSTSNKSTCPICRNLF